MTQEEKARRYDEALKVAVAAHKDEDKHLKATLERIFPELAEIEDKRIREKLIDTFNFYNPAMNSPFLLGIHKKDILAWLEKQESVGEIVERCKTSWYNEGKIAGMTEGLTDEEKYQQGWHDALEKQGEQKLTNSYCQEHCKGFQETGKCFADGDCKAKTIAETVHAGTENILNELASRIEKAEIVNVRQVLEWIEEQTKE